MLVETRILPAVDPLHMEAALDGALAVLQDGGLVAFPTDTVYGLGALAHDPGAITHLYNVKDRAQTKSIPVLLSDPGELEQVAVDLDWRARRLAGRFWPGPLTLVVPRHPGLPADLGLEPTVGVRMPDHPLALAVLRRSGPLAVSSANLSGRPSAATALEVYAQLGGRIPLILDGGSTPGGVASTVVDCTTADLKILRPGPLSADELQAALADPPMGPLPTAVRPTDFS